jgi:hypothetical protein
MGAFTKEFNEHIEKEEIKEQRRPKLNDSEDEDGEVDYNTPNLLTRGQILKLLKKRKESMKVYFKYLTIIELLIISIYCLVHHHQLIFFYFHSFNKFQSLINLLMIDELFLLYL